MLALVLFMLFGYFASMRIYDWWNGYGDLF